MISRKIEIYIDIGIFSRQIAQMVGGSKIFVRANMENIGRGSAGTYYRCKARAYVLVNGDVPGTWGPQFDYNSETFLQEHGDPESDVEEYPGNILALMENRVNGFDSSLIHGIEGNLFVVCGAQLGRPLWEHKERVPS